MKELHILIVEDDEELAKSLQLFLNEIAQTTVSHDGFEGQMLGQEGIYDLVVLDLMLPQVNGYDILKHWRNEDHLSMPVLILTAKDTLDDKVHGFQLGADDYLTKPFHREELIMRVKALLKRSGHLGNDNQLTVGPFKVNLSNRIVSVNDKPLELNGKEFDLLVYFIQNPDTIITKDQIFDRLWGFESETAISVVEVYMSNLRKKLKKSASLSPIKTLRNVGYMFETEALA
ncbi:response regulator transcription factor [Lentilactobacillus sp. IMAU92037]|uniref:response regulator transcription factor n=1 Tax=Lentilactobacillus TaxID=2767893 RepID=UPI001C2CB7CB|nr:MULTISPECIES: response regulator transcription factor [Lentilactobacillus]MBV0929721.1 response regulator transcription factor [Lentilactobacillus dabitei]MDM7517431.1 response regulator transcription factor [Lentilactobacillus sp. TOM.63]